MVIQWKPVQGQSADSKALEGLYIWVRFGDVQPGFCIRKWGVDMPITEGPGEPARNGCVTVKYRDNALADRGRQIQAMTRKPDTDILVLKSSIPAHLLEESVATS